MNAINRLGRQHDDAVTRLAAALQEIVPMAPLARLAAGMSRTLDHPAYDCFYLALAERRDVQTVTTDRRLIKRVEGNGVGGARHGLAHMIRSRA